MTKQLENEPQNAGGMGVSFTEYTVEELMSQVIIKCLEQWHTFKPTNRNKRMIIDQGVKIFDMLVKYKAAQDKNANLMK